ncbi:uridine kinase [Histophilus somni]|uniref:Uridine kinase n=1 Tax=Histophilus somni TaxID=731 RepID=A0AAX2S2Q0_HISSO|nr:uridine kinase [Histophilus somni]QEH08540.1 uridine kinase [Histophilus somni]QEH12877.1 uridine kinase [Histophilus somni]QEH24810.1 uridine kinase [Histophilus somni]QEH27362.1 uridine kinase [Histophilus somni]QEH51562.1 uridine kinase [Histophilus somni]
MSDQSCIIIAIAGASASGKSLIASTIHEELCNELGCEEIGIVTEDSYYKDQTHLSFEERIKTNYDHPNSMDRDLLIQHLCDLKKGKVVDIPVYSYVEHTRTQEVTRFEPKKVIILEGILLLTDERIRQEVNMSVFVDTPLDICFIRRLQRDMEERGRSLQSVIDQYKSTVRPMFLQFIEPSKQYADIVVPRGGKNRVAINMLKVQIQHLLNNK